MTTLREIIKKGKKKSKEATDKVLDADLEKISKGTAKATVGFFTHMLIYGSVVFVIICIFYIAKWSYFDPNWCKNNFIRHIYVSKASEPFDEFSNLDKRIFAEKWYDYSCSSTIVNSYKELGFPRTVYDFRYFDKKFKDYYPYYRR
jgi:hypothetical protein